MNFQAKESSNPILQKHKREQLHPVASETKSPKRRLSPARIVRRLIWWGRIQPNTLRQFFLCLTMTVNSGIDILTALELSVDAENDPLFAEVVKEILQKVSSGASLHSAMAQHPKVFTELQCRLVKVGEDSGSLTEVLRMLAQDEENKQRGLKEVSSKVAHPILTLCLAVPLAFLVAGSVLKPMNEVLKGFGQTLPLPAQFLVGASDLLFHPLGAVTALFFISLLALAAARGVFRNNPTLKRILLKLPYVGSTLRTQFSLRFAQALLMQFQAGITLAKAITSSLSLCGHPDWHESSKAVGVLIRDSKEAPSEALKILYKPSSIVLESIHCGEESGQLEKYLSGAISILEIESRDKIETMTASLQPIVMCFVGLMVGGVVISALLPMAKILEVAL